MKEIDKFNPVEKMAEGKHLGAENPGFEDNEFEPDEKPSREKIQNTEEDNCSEPFEEKVKESNLIGDFFAAYFSLHALLRTQKNSPGSKFAKPAILCIVFLIYNVYLAAAIYYGVTEVLGSDSVENITENSTKCEMEYDLGEKEAENKTSTRTFNYCHDVGFLIIVTAIVYIALIYFLVVKRFFGKRIYKSIIKPIVQLIDKVFGYRYSGGIVSVVIFGIITIFIIADSTNDRRRIISLLGVFILVLLGTFFSRHPDYIVWRHVTWGLILQFIFALLILRWKVGKAVFGCLGDKVKTFLDYTDAGSGFVFGYLVTQKPFNPGLLGGVARNVTEDINDTAFAFNFVFMFKILSIIYFFSFCVSMLFYCGVMQWLVCKLGWLLQVSVGTTACESLNAAANIFLGQSESPLMIRPYLTQMTNSEIHAVMTGGFATIAGSVLGAYIGFGVSASHLLSASVMSAPAALAFSKLFYPETKKSKTTARDISFDKGDNSVKGIVH